MPLAPNMLLQAAAQAKAQATTANAPAVTAEPGAKASGFAQLFARQSQSKPVVVAEGTAKTVRDQPADNADKKDLASDESAAAQPALADSGKSLPALKPDDTQDQPLSDDPASQLASLADGAVVEPALDLALDPALDPALLQPSAPEQTAQPQVEEPLTAMLVAAVAPASIDSDFDPAADPLDALPALRLAMEQGGHLSPASQSQVAKVAATPVEGELTSAQHFANGMASMLEVQADQNSADQGGDKAFSGLIDDGLKDLTSATSDTRVDDFANRLAALTQAATPKTANALPVNQPLAMHQSGWTEEVVNRVMYLSSANLKAADIQLQPAELGRLDIRVNMVPDQQTQVTFMSAHVGVREALEGQMHRLRDLFVQQGMGQVDVNVSDQSRGWQGQGQEQARQGQSGRSHASGGRLDSMDDELPASVTEVAVSTASVIGSSAVDYYA